MTIAEAQKEMRREFVGGAFGQLVSGVLWCTSAALGTWSTSRGAIVLLVVGGGFIFPMSVLLLRATGRQGAVSPANALNQLAFQVAMVLPLHLPLVGAATLYRVNWFYPALTIAVGAHYLPFAFLYGMRVFAVLGVLLVAAGTGFGLYAQHWFTPAGWFTGLTLLVFAAIGRVIAAREVGVIARA